MFRLDWCARGMTVSIVNCDDFEDENLGEFVKVQIFLLLIKAASYVVSDLNLLFIWISNLFL